MPVVAGAPGCVSLNPRYIPPPAPRLQPVHDPAQHLTILTAPTPLRGLGWQQRRDHRPLFIAQSSVIHSPNLQLLPILGLVDECLVAAPHLPVFAFGVGVISNPVVCTGNHVGVACTCLAVEVPGICITGDFRLVN